MHDRVRDLGEDARLEPVAELSNPLAVRLTLRERQLGGARQTDGRRDVFGAGPSTAILRSAVEQRLERSTAANEERADPLWRSELVARDRQIVELLRLRVD